MREKNTCSFLRNNNAKYISWNNSLFLILAVGVVPSVDEEIGGRGGGDGDGDGECVTSDGREESIEDNGGT